MAELVERAYVNCPYHRARAYLADGIGDRIKSGGRMTLRVPIAGIELKKDVIVTISPGADPLHMDQPWRIHWTPDGGGPYPDFDGELTVRADEDYTSSILELTGEYKPPGGALGEAFDSVVGARIAAITGQTLLARLTGEFESRYAEEEARKRAHPR